MYMRSTQITHQVKDLPCNLEGCIFNVFENELCFEHNLLNQKYGNPFADGARIPRAENCSVDGCANKYHAKGYCSGHNRIIITRPRKIHIDALRSRQGLLAKNQKTLVKPLSIDFVAEGNSIPLQHIAKALASESKASNCHIAPDRPMIRLHFNHKPASSMIQRALLKLGEQGIKVVTLNDWIIASKNKK